VRRLILRIHLIIALIAGAFMLVLGATGSVIAFEPELDRLFHPHASYVSSTGKVLSLTEIGDAVSRKFGGEPVVAYLPSLSSDIATEVILSRGIVAVNQYTGEVLGVRTRGQTFLGFVRSVHVRFGSGDVGRAVLKWSGVAALCSFASGLYLWWPLHRVRIQGSWSSRGYWFDLHNAVGIFSLLPLLILAGTGTAIGFEGPVTSLIDELTGSRPARANQILARPEPNPGSVPITPDRAVTLACAQLPGAQAYRVQMPRYGGVYAVALVNPRDRIAGGRNSVSIDPWTGNVISSSLSTDMSLGERIMAANEGIHTGDVFGRPSKIAVSLTSALLPIQVMTGLMIWLRRTSIGRTNPSRRAE
jgi:uncharacterized iron-regulated membrane protein